MPASFEEKSVWIQFLATLLGLGAYFAIAAAMLARGITALPAYVPLFTAAVTLIVIFIIAGHILAAIAGTLRGNPPEAPDERDRLIEWRAESRSGWILAVGILAGVTAMILSFEPVWVAHLLLLSLFISQTLALLLRLIDYRRGGIHGA